MVDPRHVCENYSIAEMFSSNIRAHSIEVNYSRSTMCELRLWGKRRIAVFALQLGNSGRRSKYIRERSRHRKGNVQKRTKWGWGEMQSMG
jgi:hypothetical protein